MRFLLTLGVLFLFVACSNGGGDVGSEDEQDCRSACSENVVQQIFVNLF